METHAELRRRLNDAIDDLIAGGHYKTGDEAVRAIAEILEAREKKLAELRAAIEEGENSGPWEEVDLEEFIARKTKEHVA
ncbi:MAG TPA: type II toxin-antitoxin system ParD family antitoxin [Rhizomicrobium sp.]|jgi:antitoxin ParD1/3/4|nr:type II toxin-antitoxin system ParD family antitoxin [Rhizomicrobium sp.]